nr:flippase-like domain-containing protein [Deltaproteobacteria bacterium]
MSDLSTPAHAAPKHRPWRMRLLVSLLVAGAFLLFMQRGGVPVLPDRDSFKYVRWWTVPTYFASLLVVHWFRAWRWTYLLRPVAKVPQGRIIAYAWVGFFAIMMLPLRMGEVVRPILLRREGRISGSAAMGTIAAERVLDGLFVALLLAATLWLVPRLPLH